MKNKKFYFPVLLAVLTVCCGCASSDRMVRMSGGVLDEYSAPPKHRVRSERFQVKSDAIAPAERGKREQISDFNTPLVNIWPFFFRSSNYFSILWPFIDWDAYGVAVRPFYNQEGDEYSILFPLSAWNNVNRDGWVLNFAWNKDGFGFVPFSWQHDSKDEFWCYYTPLFIYSKNRRPMTVLTSQDDMSAFFMLWYMNRKFEKNMSQDMTRCYYWSTIPVKRYIAAKNKWDFPKNPTKEEMKKFKKKIYDMAPVTTETGYGIFPLFHVFKSEDGYTLRALAYLAGVSRYKNSSSWDILCSLLASYECNEYPELPNGAGSWKKREKFKLLYLFQQNSEEYYPDNEVFKTFRRVSNAARQGNSFSFQLEQVKSELAKCSPGTVVPPEVTDNASLRYFIDDWQTEYAKGKVFKTAVRRNGGFMPLFWYWTDVDKYIWFSAATLSRYSRDKDGFAFWSIPLLTFMYESKSSDSSFKGVVPPFLWMSFEKRRNGIKNRIPVKTRDTKFVQSWECAETIDNYGVCGLFYKGKTRFYVAKDGVDVQEIKNLRDACYDISGNFFSLKQMRKKYEIEVAKVEKWKPKNKIDHYKKLIREEELKETLAEISKCEQKNNELIKKAEKSASILGFEFNAEDLRTSEGLNKTTGRILEQFAEIREKEDIGNGFIFRKEKFYNGDYKWRLLWFLAGGEKQDRRESVQILHFLYRKRVEGDKSETLFFPFVSILKDGKKERFSFLGRLWQQSSVDGKRGGYIFFIPWGDKKCH